MASRDPEELTRREREVLELLRRDFTNEQIAQRLGITLDGAKYHVSQILSKLGVHSREEAVGLVLHQGRRWWLQASIWAKIGLSATAFAAIVGLGILAWGVLRDNVGDEEQLVDRPTPATTTGGPAVIGSYDDPLDFRSFGRRMAEA